MEKEAIELKNAVEQFQQKMKDYYKVKEKEKAFVCDGIVDIDAYSNAAHKILWILKEPYSGSEDNAYLKDLFTMRAEGKKTDSQNTWNPIAYISYSILNNFKLISADKEIKSNKKINEVFKSIAIINVQKTEAGTRSKSSEINGAYKKHSKIILEQIKTYQPTIIINCSGVKDFAKDLKFNTPIGFGHYTNGNQVIINTYHPQQMRITQVDYINKIVQRVDNWYSSKI